MAVPCRPLVEVIAQVPDWRQRRGQRHALGAVLALACAALLAGARSYRAMADWGRHYGQPLTTALGFTHTPTPCAATLHRILAHLDVAALERLLGDWALEVLAALPAEPAAVEGLAIDGKRLCGSAKRGAPLVHLLGAVSHRFGMLVRQRGLTDKTHEATALADLIRDVVLDGLVVTMDALFTQKAVLQTILDRGGDYLVLVKHNQPTLQEAIAYLFTDTAAVADTFTQGCTLDLGHGRVEVRQLTSSTAMVGYLPWPGLAQVFCLQRRVTRKVTGVVRQETVYGITSLSAQRAGPTQLLRLVRQHWMIENGQHWVRDVTFAEDASQVHTGALPEVLATLRGTIIGLMRSSGRTTIAQTCRQLAAQPWTALALLGITPPQN